MQQVIQQVNLEQRHGSTDKVYQVTLYAECDGGFSVMGANARRGHALILRPQTKAPVSREDAGAIFAKLVRKKVAEGYRIADGTGDFTPPTPPAATPGLVAPPMQLLTPVADEQETQRLLGDDRVLAEPKLDGRRLTLVRRGTAVVGFNRRRLLAAMPASVARALDSLPGDVVCDAEVFADYAVVFDVQERDGTDHRGDPCEARLALVQAVVRDAASPALRAIEYAIGTADKRALFDRLVAESQEGIVFKDRSAPYEDGRPHQGGPQRKAKFWKSATCRVRRHNPKNSVGLEMLDGDRWVDVGNVTVKANQTMPPVGAFVEVSYLYAYRGGSLYQPELIADRSDEMAEDDCTLAQLQYKAEQVA
ncbi:MAG: DNA ligase [Gemmatimonadaceae bacterium]|nr:DNA ligase [Gemmatimonadaceae bacterium]